MVNSFSGHTVHDLRITTPAVHRQQSHLWNLIVLMAFRTAAASSLEPVQRIILEQHRLPVFFFIYIYFF